MTKPFLDENNQPISKGFNHQRNTAKATYVLRGILEGIVADKKLVEEELLFLDIWMRSQSYLKAEGDALDLFCLLNDILADKIVTQSELKELNSLIDTILEYGYHDNKNANLLNELNGLLQGTLADGILTDLEINFIEQWLNKNKSLSIVWPASELIERIKIIKEDGFISEDERFDLKNTLIKITGMRFDKTGEATDTVAEVFNDNIGSIDHDGLVMCFTGTFVNGTRKVIEKKAIELGAIVKGNVTKSLNVLVIGTIASRDWRFSSYGRKIEKVLNNNNNNGCETFIISEQCWLGLL